MENQAFHVLSSTMGSRSTKWNIYSAAFATDGIFGHELLALPQTANYKG